MLTSFGSAGGGNLRNGGPPLAVVGYRQCSSVPPAFELLPFAAWWFVSASWPVAEGGREEGVRVEWNVPGVSPLLPPLPELFLLFPREGGRDWGFHKFRDFHARSGQFRIRKWGKKVVNFRFKDSLICCWPIVSLDSSSEVQKKVHLLNANLKYHIKSSFLTSFLKIVHDIIIYIHNIRWFSSEESKGDRTVTTLSMDVLTFQGPATRVLPPGEPSREPGRHERRLVAGVRTADDPVVLQARDGAAVLVQRVLEGGGSGQSGKYIGVHLDLTYFDLVLFYDPSGGRRASRKIRNRRRFWAIALTSFHVRPILPRSCSRVLFQEVLGLPLDRHHYHHIQWGSPESDSCIIIFLIKE